MPHSARDATEQWQGSIVLVGSRIFLGAKGNINYAASKGAVVSLARSLALALENSNVRVKRARAGQKLRRR